MIKEGSSSALNLKPQIMEQIINASSEEAFIIVAGKPASVVWAGISAKSVIIIPDAQNKVTGAKGMEDNKIDADEVWKVAWTYIQTVVDTVREPFLILDEDLKVISANRTFYAFFQVTQEDTEGKRVYDLGNGQWKVPKLSILLEDILPKNTFFTDFKVEHTFPKIGHKIMLLNARRIYKTDEERPILLLAMEDITRQKILEDQLKAYSKRLTYEVSKKTAQLEARVKDLEAANKRLRGYEKQLAEFRGDLEKLKDDGEHKE